MKTKEEVIYIPDLSTKYRQSLFEAKVSAGFPSPAADYEEDKLDLNRYLIKNPAATFFVRVTGYSMTGAGIHSDDLTVKRIRIGKKKITLEPENENYSVQQINEDTDFQVWGVVTNVIHAL